MIIQQNISLKNYNTFGVDVTAERFVSVTNINTLQDILKHEKDLFILAGGSNILLTKNIKKLVVNLAIKGIKITKENSENVYIRVSAGENWHQFVLWCVQNNYAGIENLALIPGNVGTCPIQNIGAYGVEVKEVITQVEALEIKTGKQVTFSNSECQFDYRNSIFKNTAKGKYIITAVSFKLHKIPHHFINISYGAIKELLVAKSIKNPTIKDVAQAVITIRAAKLPNPKELGNAGSFFKNPIIKKELFIKLQTRFPSIPFYPISEETVKIPAGWLIEQAGFKGRRFGNAGVHKNQALVLVNYGNATGQEIFTLAQKIQQTIQEKFNIKLEIEVNVL